MDANQKLETRNSKLLLLGHRGARRYAPENTITAFDLALEHGCDGFEFDVRRTCDRHAIVCHDPRSSGLDVARSTYSSLIEADPSLTCLQDVLYGFHSRAFLYIELKVDGQEDDVVRVLHECPPERGYVVASFLPEVLRALYDLSLGNKRAHVPLGLICDNKRELALWPELPVQYVMPKYTLVSRLLVEDLHAAGKRVLVWTVNTTRDMLRMAELGVDGIVSDDTRLLCRTLGDLR